MKKLDSHINSQRFHTVVPLGDGRVHIQLAEPVTQRKAQLWLMVMLGWQRGNRIITNRGKIVAVVTWPETWVQLLKSLGAPPTRVREFRELVNGTPTSWG